VHLARAARAAAQVATADAAAAAPTEAGQGGGFDEDGVIDWACGHSSFFTGLWNLLDVEVRLEVEPFIL